MGAAAQARLRHPERRERQHGAEPVDKQNEVLFHCWLPVSFFKAWWRHGGGRPGQRDDWAWEAGGDRADSATAPSQARKPNTGTHTTAGAERKRPIDTATALPGIREHTF